MNRNKGYRKSYGLILGRKNKSSGNYEFLLVRRRYTYAFCDIVCGKYMREPVQNRKSVISRMFEKITMNEYIDIMSHDFDNLWFKIWLTKYADEMYVEKRNTFYETFPTPFDVQAYAPKVKKSGDDLWGLPKGRATSGEIGKICAIREFEEETGIEKKYYNIIDTPSVRYSYTGDDGISYHNEFYIAIAGPILANARQFAYRSGVSRDSIREVDDVKWMSVDKILALDCANIILAAVRQAISYIRKFSRGEYIGQYFIKQQEAVTKYQDYEEQSRKPDQCPKEVCEEDDKINYLMQYVKKQMRCTYVGEPITLGKNVIPCK